MGSVFSAFSQPRTFVFPLVEHKGLHIPELIEIDEKVEKQCVNCDKARSVLRDKYGGVQVDLKECFSTYRVLLSDPLIIAECLRGKYGEKVHVTTGTVVDRDVDCNDYGPTPDYYFTRHTVECRIVK